VEGGACVDGGWLVVGCGCRRVLKKFCRVLWVLGCLVSWQLVHCGWARLFVCGVVFAQVLQWVVVWLVSGGVVGGRLAHQ
jgi:hypothetical protein